MRKRNEVQAKMERLQGEIELINEGLERYGGGFKRKEDFEDFDGGKEVISIDSLKKVFEENVRLKADIEKLIENLESSRQDLFRMNSSNKSAV